jgi:hypothetical protein
VTTRTLSRRLGALFAGAVGVVTTALATALGALVLVVIVMWSIWVHLLLPMALTARP